jgi:anti-anti-sigma factor
MIKVCRSDSRARGRSELGGTPTALHAVTERRGPAVIISVRGDVDASNEGDWKYLLAEMAGTATVPGPVVVDVRELDFMGCCAYSALTREAERCRRRGITLCLVSQDPIVARIVAACGLRWLLPIHSTTGAALGVTKDPATSRAK